MTNDETSARARLGGTGRNEPCPCGSGKKYKKCHLATDEELTAAVATAPDARALLMGGWRLFEQRRPSAAEREFRAALAANPDLVDARVGIGMARMSAGDNDGAIGELRKAVEAGEAGAAKLRADGVKDAFARPEAQPYIRACHALGCLASEQGRWADSLADLERVYTLDEAAVGSEARLIAAKSLIKLERPADAAQVLEAAAGASGKDGDGQPGSGGGRVKASLALALTAAGDAVGARAALAAALNDNPHLGKALLGKLRKRVENLAAVQPGTPEEASVYAQTYGDMWTDEAKKLVEAVLAERTTPRPAASPEDGALNPGA